MTMYRKIGIIGGGNMGSALIGGLYAKGVASMNMIVADTNPQTCKNLSEKWGVATTHEPSEMAADVDILVLAVKPQHMKDLILDLNAKVNSTKTLLISIAAGITTTQIKRWLAQPQGEIVRAMPNTPALYGVGITGLYATDNVSTTKKHIVNDLLSSLGETVWVQDEGLMDVITAVSGSGPAYFFYLMEAMINSATTLGLSHEVASKLTLQTALGSAKMAQLSPEKVAHLREQVTSKGGTTQAGIKVLKDGKLEDLIAKTLTAAFKRGQELSQQFD